MTGPAIPPPALRETEQALEVFLGFSLTSCLSRLVEEAVIRSAGELDLDPLRFVARLRAGDPRCLEAITERTVVRETYFGRHPEQLAAIDRHLLRPADPGRPLRIWSAGCASGEEPYGLAMALLAAGRRGLDHVLGTDVSARALAQAREGRYGAWSLRRVDAGTRARFFVGRDPPLAVAPEVRERVEFRRANLLSEDPPAETFDLVLCRNVLIYFSPPVATAVLRKLASAVRPGGFLALGPAEAPLAAGLPFEWTGDTSAVLLRRSAADAKAAAAPDRSGRRRARRSAASGRPSRRPGERHPAPAAPAAPLAAAREAAHRGEPGEAGRPACAPDAAASAPEPFLLLAMAAEARGELTEAIAFLRSALYLDPQLAVAHASLVALHRRLGRDADAKRARRNALRALEGLEDGALLRGVARMTAGALRDALRQGEVAK